MAASVVELPTGRAYFGSDSDGVPAPLPARSAYATSDGSEQNPRGPSPAVREFIQRSRDRWRTSDQASQKNREKMRIDQKFAAGGGNQWDAADKSLRSEEGRPCLEINRIPQFIRQVTNQARANRSQIQFNPRGGGATPKLAAILQGLARAVEVESDADVAYDTAVDHQCRIGLAWIRLRSKWANDEGFEQVCSIDRIRNPLSVYCDPTIQEADARDARFLHIIGALGKDEYESRWGEIASYASLTEFVKTNSSASDWMPEGKVILAEYFYVEVEERVLLQLTNGQAIWEDKLGEWQQAFAYANPAVPPPTVKRQRTVETRVVRWCLHNAVDILEGNADRTAGRILPGTRIPIFPVIGDEYDLDGEVDYRGMVRDSIDPQRMYNFWASSIAETVGLTPKSPWLAEASQVSQYLDDWKEANRKTLSVLLYDGKTVDGNLIPPPQRNIAEPPIQGMVLGLKEADQDLKAVMGLFEASLGERGPQQSGKAITAVQQQGLIANSNYLDNLQRTKRSIGRSLLQWFPAIYDTARLIHLVEPDGKKRQVVIHAGAENKPGPDFEKPADVTDVFDIGVGQYEVTVSTGPSFQTERQENFAQLLELFKVLPGLAAIGVDIVLEQSDNPSAQALSKRAKMMLPLQVQDPADPETALPRMQAENQQLKMLVQKAHAAVTTMAETIKTQKISADAKVKVAMIQAQAQLAMAAAKLGNDRDIAAFQAEFERFQQQIDHIQTLAVADAEHDHALEQQAAAAAQEPAQGGGPT
jgi:hypothetical protein